jgi:O-antigen ligase
MAIILGWYVSGESIGPFSALAAGLVVALLAAAVVYLLAMRPVLAVIALVAAGAMARLHVDIGGLKARPEHVVAGLCCLAIPFWPRQQWPRPRWILPDLLLVLYIATILVSSGFMSIDPSKTLRWAMQQILVILPYFLLRLFCTDRERLRKVFMILLVVGAAQAAIGVFCFVSNLVFGSEFGMEMGQYGPIPGTYGIDYEANILAAISGAAFVMMLIMYLKERRRSFLWGTVITYAGMVIALARAALFAAFIALGLLLVVGIKTKLLYRPAVKTLAKTLLIANLVLLPVVMPLYIERFSTLDVTDISAPDDTTAPRVVAIVGAVDGIMAHPLLGNGTASFQLLVSPEELGFGPQDVGTWIGNTELRVLHDTGLVGFTALVCFLGSLVLRARKILKRELRPELLALLLACAVYAVTFQATEGTLLKFFWVHVGVMGCAVSVFQNPPPAPAGSNGDGSSLGVACA